ncbi:MAG: flagellar hook-length control protein FliK [Lachnospiraceae bacterium]|nr:flagellar hook-length control protein FliK [Lachnospiraceae bacterium]
MTVNNVNALLNYTAGQSTQTGNGREAAVSESFDKLMTKMSDQLTDLQSVTDGSRKEVQSTATAANAQKDTMSEDGGRQISKTDSTQSDKTRDTEQQDGKKEVAKDTEDVKAENVQEEVERKGEELVQDIAEEMDVTPEEVEAAMEVLGLTVMELFDPDNLKQVLLQLTGSTDELSLVTNEKLYDSLQTLLQTSEEDLGMLAEELGISTEELKSLLEQMVSEPVESEMPNVQDVTADQELPELNLEGMKDYTVSVHRDGETVQMKVTVDDASGAKSVAETVTDTPKTEANGFSGNKGNGASDPGNHSEGSTAGNALLQTNGQQPEITEAQTSEPVFQSSQTQEIMDQIVEYMKVNLKADTQEMEMQLHPASLGTVNVQVAAKDGILTAHFTTQNEAVRAVIETQLIQLKAQFEEQGIKVDAVEVTVANHAYGEQYSEQNENTEQEQGKAGKKARRINLDEMNAEVDLEEMEDSERIAVEMMQINGNTVDYMA